nr:putative lipoprotein signal peptidase [uncultured bacterium]
MKPANHLNWLWLGAIIIVVDQATKYWAEHILRYDVIPVFGWFDFSLVHNPGAAFGFLNRAGGWQHVFFVTLAVLVSVVLVVMTKKLKSHERHLAIAYTLIIAGATGNAIDRVIYQYVVDFIHWFYHDWHYPHFNVADISIFLGATLLISEALGKPFLNRKL